ncbi:hypothetical protein F4810DRAFT_655004 [Camillea tinctor]|nr:hypothetical protein F4810DRAFT_655004 [Camillea tinctor]
MADVYRRTGRGGAGNFYSQKDVDEVNAAAANTKDLEAQKTPSTSDPSTHPHPLRSSPIIYGSGCPEIPLRSSSGRGGAGNFTAPSTTNPSSSTTPPPTTTTTDLSTSPTTGGTISGRGGAGNWTSSQTGGEERGEMEEAEREKQRRADLAREVRESVLPRLPPKIHYMHGPGRGRKPDVVAS